MSGRIYHPAALLHLPLTLDGREALHWNSFRLFLPNKRASSGLRPLPRHSADWLGLRRDHTCTFKPSRNPAQSLRTPLLRRHQTQWRPLTFLLASLASFGLRSQSWFIQARVDCFGFYHVFVGVGPVIATWTQSASRWFFAHISHTTRHSFKSHWPWMNTVRALRWHQMWGVVFTIPTPNLWKNINVKKLLFSLDLRRIYKVGNILREEPQVA